MYNNTHYQLTTPAVLSNEISVTEIYGMHVLPNIENNWLSKIGEKGFIGWLQLLSMTLLQENLAKDGASIQYPTKKEILQRLGVSEKTFNRNILRPLFEVGLLDVLEDDQKNKLRKRGVPTSRIIVYRYPLNKREYLFKPLQTIRNFDTDYNSKAKLLGILGQKTKEEKANEKLRMVQLENSIPAEYEHVQDIVSEPNNGEWNELAPTLHTENVKGGINASFENEPEIKGGINASFENGTYPQGGNNASFEKIKGGKNATNDSGAGLERLSTENEDDKVAIMQALDIYNKTSPSSNSFIFKEKERENNNIYIPTHTYVNAHVEIPNLSQNLLKVLERMEKMHVPESVILELADMLVDRSYSYSEFELISAANKQLDYIYKFIANKGEVANFLALFKHGFEGYLASKNVVTFIQNKENERITYLRDAVTTSTPSEPNTETEQSNKSEFYNWLDERE